MYAQAAVKPNTLLRNGAYGIVMREVQICTRCACASLCAFGCFVMLYHLRHGNRPRLRQRLTPAEIRQGHRQGERPQRILRAG